MKNNIGAILLMLLLILIMGLVFVSICCFVLYSGKSVSDIPAWALWFMFNWK